VLQTENGNRTKITCRRTIRDKNKIFFCKQSIHRDIFGTKVSLAVMPVGGNSQALSSSRYPADEPLTGGQVTQLTSQGRLSSKLTQRRTRAMSMNGVITPGTSGSQPHGSQPAIYQQLRLQPQTTRMTHASHLDRWGQCWPLTDRYDVSDGVATNDARGLTTTYRYWRQNTHTASPWQPRTAIFLSVHGASHLTYYQQNRSYVSPRHTASQWGRSD